MRVYALVVLSIAAPTLVVCEDRRSNGRLNDRSVRCHSPDRVPRAEDSPSSPFRGGRAALSHDAGAIAGLEGWPKAWAAAKACTAPAQMSRLLASAAARRFRRERVRGGEARPAFAAEAGAVEEAALAAEEGRLAQPRRNRTDIRALRALRQIGTCYNKALQDHPVLTNVLTGAFLSCFGDIMCQKVMEKQGKLDCRRNAALTTFGALYNGCVNYYVVNSYGMVLPAWCKKTPLRRGISCMVLSSLIQVPLMTYPVFYIGTGLLQGATIKDACKKLMDREWPSLRIGWIFWIPLQVVNFACVPPQFRVVLMNIAGLVWSVMLDDISHSNSPLLHPVASLKHLFSRRKPASDFSPGFAQLSVSFWSVPVEVLLLGLLAAGGIVAAVLGFRCKPLDAAHR
eukprot:gnl/TRDRNA2_/TRDRNA2_36110_c0_seq1.p1 gnl/TRDRNA2_/TRDRNA2_36110_c0~~gnl/TRDRNA2_/TRDRNA2_36110_c0_seq1.p1  ORF type:complete len:398 (-),score=33.24 gnl/TRDRNA2_/TRDRNA2_36110_c0_seq1:38-1231(-)